MGSLNKSIVVSEDAKLNFLAEAAWFKNFEGGADNALYLTGAASLETGAMIYSLTYTQHRTLASGSTSATEHLFDASIAYDLGDNSGFAGENWILGAGYSLARADGETSQIVGLKLSTEFGGSTSFGQ